MKISNRLLPKDLKKYYTILLELGTIGSLLLFIGLTKVDFEGASEGYLPQVSNQEVISVEDVVKTNHPNRPPAPPVPKVPVEVPNSTVIEDEVLDISAELNFDQPLEIPAEPRNIQIEKEDASEEDFFVAVEHMPELIGTMADLQRHIVYPEKALQARISGMVVVQFVVNKEGEVENPKIIRGIGGGCDLEALRVAKMATFKPGLQRGVPVRVQYSLPFRFIMK
ncbi:MAG: energy transducer TonB [Fodinibius sp.]|nr:energy transducer TonB [Fodinibius sp.]